MWRAARLDRCSSRSRLPAGPPRAPSGRQGTTAAVPRQANADCSTHLRRRRGTVLRGRMPKTSAAVMLDSYGADSATATKGDRDDQ
jgi:hypothetical protein